MLRPARMYPALFCVSYGNNGVQLKRGAPIELLTGQILWASLMQTAQIGALYIFLPACGPGRPT